MSVRRKVRASAGASYWMLGSLSRLRRVQLALCTLGADAGGLNPC